MPSIAIIGPGAIGGTVAAWLSQDKHNAVSLCTRTPFHHLQVDTPEGPLFAQPPVFTSPDEVGPVNWVLIATKAYAVTETARWLPNLIGPDTRVAILQNGVEHIERFSPYVDPTALVPVVVDCPAERKTPGHIWQRRAGHLIIPDNEAGRELARLFTSNSLTAATTTDFKSHAWRKLALNCTGVVSALLLKSVDIRQNEELTQLMRSLIRECIAVGRAEGAVPDDRLEENIIEGYRRQPGDSINSLHADRLAGRPLEIDARNGAVVRFGQKHGIDTPMNALMTSLLKAATD